MELTSITFITVLTLLIFLIYLGIRKKRQQTAELLSLYRNAIAQGDKLKAHIAGRNYYASMRPGGRLTIYDEQAITNDLASINNQIFSPTVLSIVSDEFIKLKKLYMMEF